MIVEMYPISSMVRVLSYDVKSSNLIQILWILSSNFPMHHKFSQNLQKDNKKILKCILHMPIMQGMFVTKTIYKSFDLSFKVLASHDHTQR